MTMTRITRFIHNRNKRTGNTWRVIDRHYTNDRGERVDNPGQWDYERVVIENEFGERVVKIVCA